MRLRRDRDGRPLAALAMGALLAASGCGAELPAGVADLGGADGLSERLAVSEQCYQRTTSHGYLMQRMAPRIAAAPDGQALAVWQHCAAARLHVSAAEFDGRWSAPVSLGLDVYGGLQVEWDDAGEGVVVWTDPSASRYALFHRHRGWSPSLAIPSADGDRDPQLLAGGRTLVWRSWAGQDGRAWPEGLGGRRRLGPAWDGAWRRAIAPRIIAVHTAAAREGHASAYWLQPDAAGGLEESTPAAMRFDPASGWEPPVVLDPRPGQRTRALAVAFDATGAEHAVWCDTRAQVLMAARRWRGDWTQPAVLDGPRAQYGGAYWGQLAFAANGEAQYVWAEAGIWAVPLRSGRAVAAPRHLGTGLHPRLRAEVDGSALVAWTTLDGRGGTNGIGAASYRQLTGWRTAAVSVADRVMLADVGVDRRGNGFVLWEREMADTLELWAKRLPL